MKRKRNLWLNIAGLLALSFFVLWPTRAALAFTELPCDEEDPAAWCPSQCMILHQNTTWDCHMEGDYCCQREVDHYTCVGQDPICAATPTPPIRLEGDLRYGQLCNEFIGLCSGP